MPLFDYECPNCDFIKKDVFIDKYDKKVKCPECNSIMKKLPSQFNPIFKGNGFYETDYKKQKNKK